MSDTSSPDFSVVDRRRAASPENPVENQSADTQPQPASVDNTAESEANMPFDPSALVMFGAMQVETRDLVRMLFAVFDQHAWLSLGLIADPVTGELRADLPAAQLAIDCAHFVLGKIEPELSENELRDARRRLNDLRVNYLSKMKENSGE